MKSYLIFLTAAVIISSCGNRNEYTLRGSFNGDQDEEYIYLVKFMGSNLQIDSTKIENGKFVFKGTVDFPEVYVLHYNMSRITGFCPIFLEPSQINVIIDLNDWGFGSKVTGGKLNEEYYETQKTTKEIIKLRKRIESVDDNEKKGIEKQIQKLYNEYQTSEIDYIKNNPNSPISIFLLSKIFFSFPLEELGDILTIFSPEIRKTAIYKNISDHYNNQLKLKNSTLALTYSNDILELKSIDFNSRSVVEVLRNQNPNKAMYIDIWGTWCGPCKKEFPNSRELSNKLTSDQLSFVYLCVQSEEEEWKKMIKKEKLKGQHYLISNEIADKLLSEVGRKEKGIPDYILLAEDGNIINNNAPKPSSGVIEKILIELSN